MMRSVPFAALAVWLAVCPPPAAAYPLDGYPQTGVLRLEAYRLAAAGSGRPSFLTEGEMLPSDAIHLGLADRPGFEIPAPDPELSARLTELLGADAASYGVALLDWSDPDRPRYAAVNADRIQNPGSVGKVMVLLAWFQTLADVHPDDLRARRRILHDAVIEADRFIRTDDHKVPVWTWGMNSVDRRPIAEGDRANAYTFLDWMASASSNAAGSMMMKHLVLLRHFGVRYPVSEAEGNAFLEASSKSALSNLFLGAMQEAARRNGIDWAQLRQGAFFTREAKTVIPGTNSVSTAAELMRYIVRMEQGRLVDRFSSLEIKKLLYLTDKRIRYAASPVLDDHAVYFKSGSLYSCRPERGYDCGKFRGNRLNFMNSMVVVETVDRDPPLRYATVVLSNVLKKDSSELHQELASKIHHIVEGFHPSR